MAKHTCPVPDLAVCGGCWFIDCDDRLCPPNGVEMVSSLSQTSCGCGPDCPHENPVFPCKEE